MSRTWRKRAGIGALAASTLTGAAAAPQFGALTTMPAAVAVAGVCVVVAFGPDARRVLPAITGVAGAASLAATAGLVLTGATYAPADAAATGWALAEIGALLVLTVAVLRAAPARQAAIAAGLSGIAVPAWLLRFGWGPVTTATLGGFSAWALLALSAVAAGLYLRSLEHNRARSLAEARRVQRLQLAHDLHDFVAHDVSGMLAQAQAGQILARHDPAAATAAFQRIEHAGRQALASLDRTVHMLREDYTLDTAAPATVLTLADLPDLLARFATATAAQARLDIDPRLSAAGTLPRELGTTAYRIVVEALTNVRRHAPGASLVTVSISRTPTGAVPAAVFVAINDDGPKPAPAGAERRGGLGLPGLAERVEALGGTLTAGPGQPTGWQIAAVLPLGADGR